jgi:hypothetical protein
MARASTEADMWEWLTNGWLNGLTRKRKSTGKAALQGQGTVICSGDVREAPVINYSGLAELTGFGMGEASGSVSVLELQGDVQLYGLGDLVSAGQVFVPVVSLVGSASMVGTGATKATGNVQAAALATYGTGTYGSTNYGG